MIAFFDLDRTLLAKNSGTLWVKKELREGRLSPFNGVRVGWWLVRYSLGFADLEYGIRIAVRSLAGTTESELTQRVREFYQQEVHGIYRPGAHKALAEHRARGERCVLLTSASCYLAQEVTQALQLDGWIANRFEVDARGHFTGEPLGAVCYGIGKRTLALEYCQAQGVSLADCAFYTDSMADLSVLEVVGRPVAVHPDPRLLRISKQRGWPVASWD